MMMSSYYNTDVYKEVFAEGMKKSIYFMQKAVLKVRITCSVLGLQCVIKSHVVRSKQQIS